MIYFVVALPAEARPLVTHFGLVRATSHQSVEVFERPGLALIVSGVGRHAAASAVDALVEVAGLEGPSVWLNLGIAGHRDHVPGTVVLADSVVDGVSGTTWALRPPRELHFEVGPVHTVARVELDFETEGVYEMEAAGFCERALALTVPGLVQVVKIVSDNRRTGTVWVSARRVQALVEETLPKLDGLIAALHRRARRIGAAGEAGSVS
jgi:nucleoside phosphorylase